MIERLTNCPNCGGILNEAGRCIYCGSKVFDFVCLDFSNEREQNNLAPKTYIRIKTNQGIALAPISVNSVTITEMPIYAPITNFDGREFVIPNRHFQQEMNIECNICGDIIYVDKEVMKND